MPGPRPLRRWYRDQNGTDCWDESRECPSWGYGSPCAACMNRHALDYKYLKRSSYYHGSRATGMPFAGEQSRNHAAQTELSRDASQIRSTRHIHAESCFTYRDYWAGWRVSSPSLAEQAVSCPWHQTAFIIVQFRPHRPYLQGSSCAGQPFPNSLRRYDRLNQSDPHRSGRAAGRDL